jgi:uncharacterized membrane protein YfcA
VESLVLDGGLLTDPRWIIGVASILLAGFMKGLSGMGLPLVATPILATLSDLPTAIAITVPATVLSNVPVLYAFRAEWRQARRLAPLLLPAIVGIVLGTRILVGVDPGTLRGLLGALVVAFVSVSYFRLIPHLGERLTRRLSPFVGVAAGVLQGAAGQSGPIISIFFFQLGLSRAAFLFVINAFFLVVDATQMLSLASHGLYTPSRTALAAGVVCLAMPTLLLALRFHEWISEERFRLAVLLVLFLTGIMLLVRSIFA